MRPLISLKLASIKHSFFSPLPPPFPRLLAITMIPDTLQRARDILKLQIPEGGLIDDAYWINDDELDSVGIVDLFCHEEFEDHPTDALTIDTNTDISFLDSPGNFPFSSLITPRTFYSLGVGLDFDLAHIFDDDDKYQREFVSEHGLSLAIDSNGYSGFNLGQFVTDSIYSLVTFSPFSVQSSSPKSFFSDEYF